MSDKILHKRSLTSGSIPSTESLEYGELAINVADGAIYLKKSGSTGDTIESVITTNTVTTGTVTIDGSILATTVDAIGITGSLQGTAQTASYVEWNNVDNKPTLVSQSVFNEYTQSTDLRLNSLELESGSVRNEFNLYTQSNDTINTTQNNRLDLLSTESGSIRSTVNIYTQSTDLRIQSLETESGSIRTELNLYTSSNDTINTTQNNRLDLLSNESASIRSEFNSYTQSNDTVNNNQNNRLTSLETESGSIRNTLNSYTQSTDLRLGSLETESGSIKNTFNSYTSSNDTINTTQNSRLDHLSTESGSIRTTLNTYTSSNNERVQSLEIESASVKGRLGNIENFSASQLVLNPTFATTGSNIFIGNQTISGSVIQSGSFTQTGSFIVNGIRYPETTDGEFTFFQYDGLGNVTLEYVNTLYEVVYNPSLTQIPKGTPLYVSGSEGAAARVFIADASDPLKMPVIYIAADNIEPVSEGRGVLLGLITGVNTTGYGPGTEIYVAPGGGWTNDRPTGSAIVQTLGIVTKEGNGGQGVVLNPGPNNIPNLTTGHFWIGNGNWLPTPITTASFTSTASFNEYTSSANGRFTRLETESGSVRTTLNSYTQSTDLRLNTIETQTSSYARTDTSNTFTNLQTFTDINVNGTASFAYIQAVTGSSTSIGDAFIILNENTPASNFAGIKVIDSGSSFTTASFVYDGLNNNWVFQHEGSESSGSSLAIFGPLSVDGLGTEVGLTQNRIPKAITDHGHHIGDSNMSDDGVKVQITLPLNVTNDITGSVIKANSGFIGNLTGTSSTASYVQWNSVDNKPLLVSQSTFDTFQTNTNNRLSSLETTTGSINSSLANIRSFTESIDLRVGKLEIESGSIRVAFNSYTSSNDSTNTTQNSRLTSLETASGSAIGRLNNLETFTSSINTTIKTQLDVNTVISGSSQVSYTGLSNTPSGIVSGAAQLVPLLPTGTVSGSSQVIGILDSLNTYTSSNDTTNTTQNSRLDGLSTFTGSATERLNNLETFSGSINTKFSTLATYTGSNDTLNTTQNNRLDALSTFTGSAIGRLNNIESFTSSINTTIKAQLNANTVVSGSSQVSYIELSNIPTGIVSGSTQVIGILSSLNSYTSSNDITNTTQNSRLTSLETQSGSAINRLNNIELFSGSVNSKFSTLATYTGSNDTLNTTQTNRLDLLSTESGSIRSAFNSYTSSNDTTNTTQNSRLDGLSTFTGSTTGRLNNLETFTSSINTTIKTQLDVNTVISSSAQIRTLTYYREDVMNNSSYTINHNLNELYPIVQVYESGSREQVIPLKIKSNSVNQVLVEFTSIFSGSIIVKT